MLLHSILVHEKNRRASYHSYYKDTELHAQFMESV